MFENLFRDRTQAGNEENTTTLMVPEPTGNTIIFFHHEADRDLWNDLAPHLNIVMLRLSNLFEWKFYYYRAIAKSHEDKHEAFISDLEHTFLFLPCTSVAFLNSFWCDMQKDARMMPLLSKTYIQPVPFRAVHGVSQTLLERPLAAYPAGAARDDACMRIVAALEQKLLAYKSRQSGTDVQVPVALLEETSSRLLVAPSIRK